MQANENNLFNQNLVFNEQLQIHTSLDFDSLDTQSREKLELDYQWDFLSDQVITPTIIHEWRFLDALMGRYVTTDATFVLSVGGGGNSRTHFHLSNKTNTLFVLNPGLWDLTTYPDEFEGLHIVKIRGVGETLPFKNETISAIEIPSTLDHVSDPKEVIAEAFRVLESKGKIGITLGNERSWYRNLFRFFGVKFEDSHEHAHSFHFKPRDIEELLRGAGFGNIRTIGTGYLKLPKVLERKISGKFSLTIHRFVSNRLLRILFSRHNGGMYLVFAEKNSPRRAI